MADLFVLALLGHLVGDYLLQTKQMALTKSAPGWPGALTCTLHVAIYTVAVTAFLATATLWAALPLVMLFIAVPHWLIDRYSLASHWLRLIRGRTFEAAAASTDKHQEFDVAFTAIVYTVTDNTMHLLCLLPVIWLLR